MNRNGKKTGKTSKPFTFLKIKLKQKRKKNE